LDKAYQNFLENKSNLHYQFQQFCESESSWLNDFALFMVIKKENGRKPWFQWDEEYKLRRPKAMEEYIQTHSDEINKVKWIQFIFSKQWKELKDYCNNLGIQLIGDLPFYVSYDSSDAWSHKEIFAIDEHGNRTGMAGVPPDTFSTDGQLWGMPVFKWDVLKERGYDWWIERIKKNKELFDLVRIDHFRAFAEYWEVPAGEDTAKNGLWKPGPGSEFFETIKDKLGELPFVAEDLGEVDDKVFNLRDEFDLPGMKVLQFAFGDDMTESNYIPHNYEQNFIVYTGTHDNDTIKGWYKYTDEKTRKRVEQYIGKPVQESDVNIILARLAYGSVARIAILPLQDVLGLDETARMNVPASGENNWTWRLLPGEVGPEAERLLQEWTWLYNRG
jgi:4-alpha-glucanotransferase